MTRKEKCALIRQMDREKRDRNHARRQEERDYRDFCRIQPISKRSAANAAKSARALKEEKYRSGERIFIEVGTAVGREINGRIYGIRSIEVKTGATWVRRSSVHLPPRIRPAKPPAPEWTVEDQMRLDRRIARHAQTAKPKKAKRS